MQKPNLDGLSAVDILRAENADLRRICEEQQKGLVKITQSQVSNIQALAAVLYTVGGWTKEVPKVRITPELLDTVRDYCGFRVKSTPAARVDGKTDSLIELVPLTAEEKQSLDDAIAALDKIEKLAPKQTAPNLDPNRN